VVPVLLESGRLSPFFYTSFAGPTSVPPRHTLKCGEVFGAFFEVVISRFWRSFGELEVIVRDSFWRCLVIYRGDTLSLSAVLSGLGWVMTPETWRFSLYMAPRVPELPLDGGLDLSLYPMAHLMSPPSLSPCVIVWGDIRGFGWLLGVGFYFVGNRRHDENPARIPMRQTGALELFYPRFLSLSWRVVLYFDSTTGTVSEVTPTGFYRRMFGREPALFSPYRALLPYGSRFSRRATTKCL
jgi:hypothetical protein